MNGGTLNLPGNWGLYGGHTILFWLAGTGKDNGSCYVGFKGLVNEKDRGHTYILGVYLGTIQGSTPSFFANQPQNQSLKERQVHTQTHVHKSPGMESMRRSALPV